VAVLEGLGLQACGTQVVGGRWWVAAAGCTRVCVPCGFDQAEEADPVHVKVAAWVNDDHFVADGEDIGDFPDQPLILLLQPPMAYLRCQWSAKVRVGVSALVWQQRAAYCQHERVFIASCV